MIGQRKAVSRSLGSLEREQLCARKVFVNAVRSNANLEVAPNPSRNGIDNSDSPGIETDCRNCPFVRPVILGFGFPLCRSYLTTVDALRRPLFHRLERLFAHVVFDAFAVDLGGLFVDAQSKQKFIHDGMSFLHFFGQCST